MSAASPRQRPAAAWPWLIPVVRAWGGFAGWLAAKPISLVLALAVTHGMLYAVIVPPWQAPDETTHYEYLRALSTSPEWLPLQMARPDSVFQEVMTSARKFRWWEHRKRPTPAESPALSEEWNLTACFIIFWRKTWW